MPSAAYSLPVYEVLAAGVGTVNVTDVGVATKAVGKELTSFIPWMVVKEIF